MKKRRFSALFAAAVLTAGLTACRSSDSLRLGTGNNGGNYYAYGNAVNSITAEELIVKETAGSRANLRLLDEGFLDMAIVQSDVLSEAVNGTGDFAGAPVNGISAVAGLYTEAFQVIVPADSNITDITGLQGKTISVGEDGSGVAVNAEYVLRSAGLDFGKINKKNLTYTESAAALAEGTIDAFFMISGSSSAVLNELSSSMDIRILSLDERTVSYMTNLYPGYYRTVIPSGTYAGQDGDITTIGVKAVLVADVKNDQGRIKDITAALFEKSSDIKYSISVAEPDAEFATADIPCGFHKGAAEYYAGIGITVETDAMKAAGKIVFGAQDE